MTQREVNELFGTSVGAGAAESLDGGECTRFEERPRFQVYLDTLTAGRAKAPV